MGGIEKPILLDLPVPIRTKRLVLRPPAPGDGLALNEAISESIAELAPRMPWANPAPTVQDSEESARKFAAGFILRTALPFLIFHDRRLLGMCALQDIRWNIPSAAIGYWLRTSETGRGYMTEAVNALALYAFRVPGMRRISLAPEDRNLKSAGIPERLGFILEGRAENCGVKPDGTLRTSRIYVRFNADGLDDAGVSWQA